MAAKKARKRAYIPPSNEVLNRREHSGPRVQRTVKSSGRGAARQQYEYPKPSLQRTLKRLPIYFVLIFGLQYFFVGQQGDYDTAQRMVAAGTSALFVTVLFAPFMHIMDKFAYNRYLQKTGQQQQATRSTDES